MGVERQRSVDFAVERRLWGLPRMDRSGPAWGGAVDGSFAGAAISRMGLPWHHSLPVRRLCGRHPGHRSLGRVDEDVARLAGGGAVSSWTDGDGAGRGPTLS